LYVNQLVILNKAVSKVQKLPNGYQGHLRELHFLPGTDGELDGAAIETADGKRFMIAPSVINSTLVDGMRVSETAIPLTTAAATSLNRYQGWTQHAPNGLLFWLEKGLSMRRANVGFTRTQMASQLTLLDPGLHVL
jgi:hypothetical protein